MVVLVLVVTVVQGSSLEAQTSEPGSLWGTERVDAFDVVSIRRNVTGSGPVQRGQSLPGGRWIMVNDFVTSLIHRAYPTETGEIINAPAWIRRERYDVDAKAEGVAGRIHPERWGPMIKALLAERFKLAAHIETRERQLYELVRTKPNQGVPSSLRRIDVDCGANLPAFANGERLTPTLASNGMVLCAGMNRGDVFRSGGITMAEFAVHLKGIVGGLVRDETRLPGRYEFVLRYNSRPLAATPSELPDVFTAIQSQLGLKLQRRTAPTEVLVIDRIERPTAN